MAEREGFEPPGHNKAAFGFRVRPIVVVRAGVCRFCNARNGGFLIDAIHSAIRVLRLKNRRVCILVNLVI